MGSEQSGVYKRKMKTASAGLITILNSSDQAYIADLYTFTLNDGSIQKYTNADKDIGAFVSSNTITINRNGIRIVRGVEVDTLKLQIYCDPSSTFMRSLQNGGLDGSRVLVERAIMSTWGDLSNGTIIVFSGRISDADFDRTQANINVKSDFELLNIQMPKNLYQPSCSHSLYGTGCGVIKSSFTVSGSVIFASTTQSLLTDVAAIPGIYDQGVILFTSGPNHGVKRTVKRQDNGLITMSLPLSYTPTIGDTFQISQGCDKTQITCNTKFNNLTRFRGFPYVPPPEVAR